MSGAVSGIPAAQQLIALLYYDYTLTWTREVQYFWKRKLSVSSVFYVFCRYALVANVVYPIALAKEISSLSCDNGYKICASLGILGRIGILSVWGIRTAAVFHGNKWIVFLFSSLGMSVFILNIAHVPYVVCAGSTPITHQILAIVTALYEVLTALFTTIRCFQLLRCKGNTSIPRDGIIFLVLQQGLLYFGFVSSFAFGVIVLQYIEPLKGTWVVRLLNGYNTPICGLMTARYLLHLREWENEHTCAFTTSKEDLASSIMFHQRSLRSFGGWTEEFMQDSLFNSGILENCSCDLSVEKSAVLLDDVSSLQYELA
ncbi:hypothetical protein CPB83DRAFT_864888 [Crepidotus variabilis]|uniref:DUF6533 domain-containing protein n=1 Tax=Crepidotus variabilis TaxID=179855 RepID=A0A9P6E4B0_9AGAR|nr:hypothetical protein CPB83DRAFT_864888 [Crepidotus variabilis]